MSKSTAARPPACVLCRLSDADAPGSLRRRLATAVAYGDLVLAEGHGLATCDACDEAIRAALARVGRSLRRAGVPPESGDVGRADDDDD